MTLELIQLIADQNNLHDIDTWVFFSDGYSKPPGAVLIVTNTWNIVMGVFESGSERGQQRLGALSWDTSLNLHDISRGFEANAWIWTSGRCWGCGCNPWCASIMWALTICIFFIHLRQNDRDLPRHLHRAPSPMATMINREWSGRWVRIISRACLHWRFRASHHRLRGNLCGPCAEHGRGERHLHGNLDCMGYTTVLLCFTLFKDQVSGQERVQRTLTEVEPEWHMFPYPRT